MNHQQQNNPVYVSTGAFIGRVNLRDPRPFLDIAQTLDCDGFEFMFYESWYNEIDSILQLFKKSGHHFPVLHVEKRIGELIALDETDEALRRFDCNCRIAERLQSEKLVFHLWNGFPSDSFFEKNLMACDALIKRAKSYGLDLTIENVVCVCDSPLNRFLSLIEHYSDIRFTFDTKMASFHQETEAIFSPKYSKLLPAVSHLHINDHSGAYKDFSQLATLHIGEGKIHFEQFFSKLKTRNFFGSITLECSSMNSDGTLLPHKMNDSVHRVREFLNSSFKGD